jgi:DNA-binding GntR family transcriptional regulator
MTRVGDNHRSLPELARDQIRTMIIVGELVPGQRLREEVLALRLGMSRGPVRAALADLDRSGLVEITSRRGAQVVTHTPEDADQMYRVRMSLETLAIRSIPTQLQPEQCDALKAALARHDELKVLDDVAASVEADMDLHREICKLSDNPFLLAAWELIADPMSLAIAIVHRFDPEVSTDRRGHRPIVDALLTDDLDTAADALRMHLDASRAYVVGRYSMLGATPRLDDEPSRD